MDRREFIKSTLALAALTALSPKSVLDTAGAAQNSKIPDLVALRRGTPVEMFRKGIDALGGMSKFVKPGQSVVVKPNIGWDAKPELAANTNPELIGEIVKQTLAAGASKVEVLDHTCNEWTSCYKNSGIEKAVIASGGKMLPAHLEKHYIEVKKPEAVVMKKAKIHKSVMETDVFINVPILKNHGGAKMSCAIKNLMGIVWDRQYMHRANLNQTIADLALYRTPDLNVVDAYRIMVSNGPRGVSEADVRMLKYMLLSRDIVAIDVNAAKLIGYELPKVSYIKLAGNLGLGKFDTDKLNIQRLEV